LNFIIAQTSANMNPNKASESTMIYSWSFIGVDLQ